jgi:natural product biosynthesis luciferase-like monooxygenase protein
VAAVTERVKIRAGSVVGPLHHPLRIAEEWSVVDNISNGRAGIAFASGWHAVDFVLRPENYAARRDVMLESVQQVRKLWRGESMSLADGGGTLHNVRIFPPPVQPELPVWITSARHVDTFRRAGAVGAGVLTHLLGQEIDDLAGKIAAYRDAITESGRADGWPGHVVLMVHTFLGDDEDDVREVVRPPLTEYLRSSLGLTLEHSSAVDHDKIDRSTLDADAEFLVQRSFDRYFDNGGLLGTVGKGRRVVERLRDAGVDELACLIDFGLQTKVVLGGLAHLNRLREMTAPSVAGR